MTKSRGLHPFKPRRWWTSTEDEALRHSHETDQPIEGIAQALGRTVQAVWTRASYLGLPRKPRSDAGSADVQRSCECCGAEFIVTKGEANSRPARFCGTKCANKGRRHALYAAVIEDNSIPEPNSGCWLWTGAITGAGYGAIRIDTVTWAAHRLSYVLAYGDPPTGQPIIRHLCNNPGCVNPRHLSSGTAYDNAQDCTAAGNRPLGSEVWNAKLTESVIPTIIARHRVGASQRGLAAHYGVSQRAIQFVVRGITWKHASGL